MVTRDGCWPRMPPRLPRQTDPALTPPTRGTIWACVFRAARRTRADAKRILLPDDVADHGTWAARRSKRSGRDAIANVGDGERADGSSLHVQNLARLGILNFLALVIDGEGLALGETSRASGVDR